VRGAALRSNQRGFSLIELVITIGILGIIAAIAVPSYTSYILRSHRTDAMRALTSLRQALERCYSQNFSYTTPACPAAPGAATTSANGYYNITYPTLNATQYTLLATATGRQTHDTNCASMQITNAGQQTSLNSGGTDSTLICWGAR
jgi:type IV pilus assembly protein PilE